MATNTSTKMTNATIAATPTRSVPAAILSRTTIQMRRGMTGRITGNKSLEPLFKCSTSTEAFAVCEGIKIIDGHYLSRYPEAQQHGYENP